MSREVRLTIFTTEVDRPEWSRTRPEVETSVTAMDTVMTWWL